MSSGEIVVQAVAGHYKRQLARNWAASLLGHSARHWDTVSFSGKSLRVDTVPTGLPISIDGEVLAHTPVTARIAAGVIDVMAPPVETVSVPA